jgi:hypothetical protein
VQITAPHRIVILSETVLHLRDRVEGPLRYQFLLANIGPSTRDRGGRSLGMTRRELALSNLIKSKLAFRNENRQISYSVERGQAGQRR